MIVFKNPLNAFNRYVGDYKVYIHIGDGVCIRDKDIIGVFDLEVTTTMRTTGDFLRVASEEGFTVAVATRGEMPKSFVLADTQGQSTVYISPISTATIKKRLMAGN